ncbi:hypothetical protein BUALT_Bualt08G0031800 [Buddleja alternifolia]|uniref:Epidermal patterning factor-like protein n=1 Tax=Buddleja alternifolia TaxID=168488 RepID=A0AAV6XE11_9LAMI|nr:hypothetical protein BUALT_Bualt08G0031600 [Buddleja alternifolia]KAG8377427.1 hypothetical protein BUALT_Bualt08G0031800 [Buddleja alternifolia]
MACMKVTLQTNTYLPIVFLLLFYILFMAQGRQLPDATLIKDEVKMRVLIGSRPPRCDQRCQSCGHCEAVQVPINNIKFFYNQQITINHPHSRGDDRISNYKPMCWKCKCGDFISNP